VEDNLIKLEKKVGTKGNKSGVEEKAYRLPTSDMLPRERHDWYCFYCHSGGEVLLCTGCHRVFHEKCLKAEAAGSLWKDPDEDEEMPEWYCHLCRAIQIAPDSTAEKKERKDLNHLLKLLVGKLKNKLPPEGILLREAPRLAHKLDKSTKGIVGSAIQPANATAPQPIPVPIANNEDGSDDENAGEGEGGIIRKKIDGTKEDIWRGTFLLKSQMTLEEMERRCGINYYRILDEFRGDAQQIVHNIVIYHGAHSSLADVARQMLRDCVADLREIKQCRDCYRYANEAREKYWFCKPCRPFHELVYAKQKGFPYWPAKVIESKRDGLQEVRFFGGYHQKAIVEKAHTKPISVNVHTLQVQNLHHFIPTYNISFKVKRTALFNKAMEELRKHQELLDKFKDDKAFLSEPYGNPFANSAEMRAALSGDGEKGLDGAGSGGESGAVSDEGAGRVALVMMLVVLCGVG